MTDERIERVRNALGQYAAWGIREGWTMYANAPEALDSLERELTELREELSKIEGVLVAADRVHEAYQAMLEGRDIGSLPDWTGRLSHHDEVTHG